MASLASTSGIFSAATYCAVLTSGGVDCWGDGAKGESGNRTYGGTSGASVVPVKVKGVGGLGTLAGVVTVRRSLGDTKLCAIVQLGGVGCWGYGEDGELGHGTASNANVRWLPHFRNNWPG